MQLPTHDTIRDLLATNAKIAHDAGDRAAANAANKAAYEASTGLLDRVRIDVDGSLLVPSRSNAGTVYRSTATCCTCPAGDAGKLCWHSLLAESVDSARDHDAQLRDEAAVRDAERLPFDPAADDLVTVVVEDGAPVVMALDTLIARLEAMLL